MDQLTLTGDTAAGIATSIEAAVTAGILRAGDPVPTVRELAARLTVSPTTVAAAYKLLQARGLVTGLGRRGTRITGRPGAPVPVPRHPLPEGTIDLASGNPDPDLLPPLAPALRAIGVQQGLYDDRAMLPALATFVAAEFEADGIAAEALTVVSGGLDAIERILREHLRPGDRVAVEDPSFPGIGDLLAASGFHPLAMAIDDEGPLPDALASALRARAQAVIVTLRAQNPTGAAVTPERAADLRRVLAAHPDVLLIESDPAGPVAGAPLAPIGGAGMRRWAVVRSVSKFLGPDLRTAFVAGDATTIARVEGRHALGARWVSHILQHLVLALWSDPAGGRRLARAADVYQQRREALKAACAARGIEAHGASGLNVWLRVGEEAQAVTALLEKGWAVMPGERFRLRTPPAIRITVAALKPADADRLAADLSPVIARSVRGRFA